MGEVGAVVEEIEAEVVEDSEEEIEAKEVETNLGEHLHLLATKSSLAKTWRRWTGRRRRTKI